MKKGKIYGKRCVKCVSKQNNEKLKNKESGNYYSEYYIKNKETFAIKDRERYLKNKAKKALENQVLFQFNNLQESKNLHSESLKISETSENADDIEIIV
jgi:hypothetical protein